MFQAAVTDAVGHIVKQTSEQPPKYLVKLLFSFRGVSEVEVLADRIHADKWPFRTPGVWTPLSALRWSITALAMVRVLVNGIRLAH